MHPIVVATDGSTAARGAVDAAVSLAAGLRAPLHVLHVLAAANWELQGQPRRAMTTDEQHAIHRATAHAAEHSVEAQVELLVEEGSPAETIATYAAQEDAWLIVIGSRRRTGLGAAVLGSVSQGVVHHASVPVLIVPEGTTLA